MLEELKAKETAALVAELPQIPVDPSGQDSWESPARPARDHVIETLFIDCMPVTQSFTSAHTLIAAAAQEVADDNGVPHALLIDYGKGGAMVAAQLAHTLRNGPVLERVYLETRSSEGKACLQVLTGMSKNVVKGVF